jgi:NDP-sugar pyrophosphorylase family protein
VPRGREARGSFHFIGVQVAHRDAFSSLADNVPVNSIGQVYDELIRTRPGAIRGHVCEGSSFHDIGTVADYWMTSKALSVMPFDSIIWDRVTIAAGSRVHECIVTDGVAIGPGETYRRAILRRGVDGRTTAEPLNLPEAAKLA